MFQKTLSRFQALSKTTRAMVYLFFVYEFTQIITEIFLSTFVFLETGSIFSLAVYNLVYFTACLFGFVFWGLLMAHLQISLRFNYLKAFFIFFSSFFILLFFDHSFTNLLLFSALNGLGLGMFWVGVHSYEMIHTNNENRDFYSSMVSAGGQVLVIFAPLFATLLFLVSEKVLHLETFQLLFYVLPFSYLLALPFLFQLPNFTPEKIKWSEIKRLLLSSSLSKARHYYLAGAFDWSVLRTILPVLSIAALGTVVNIGIVETIMGLISIFIITFLSHQRNEGNRVQIMLYAVLGIIFGYVFLFFADAAWYFYVLYSFVAVVLRPVLRVSEHVIDLRSVELIQEEGKSFYPGLLYRDFVLWTGRAMAMFIMMGTALFFESDLIAAKIGVVIAAVFLLVLWWTAKQLTMKN